MHLKLPKLHLAGLVAATILTGNSLSAQTVLFEENFEGSSSKFTLNTTDVSSSTTTDNIWVINNSYDGGPGSAPCGFFNVNFGPRDTPEQDQAVTGAARSKYMHINSKLAASQGITNCMYIDPNPFFPTCLVPGNAFAKMTAPISTTGYTDVELSFYWICRTNSKAFGEVYFSTNNGASWALLTSPRAKYFGDTVWKTQTISNLNFDNQATLQFGFRWANGYHGTSDSLIDPAFGVDEIKITGVPGSLPTLSHNYQPNTVCAGAAIQVPVSSTGSFASSNNYQIELSDADGNFTSPVLIGSSQSSANSVTVSAQIPANTPGGSGYRIRVVSTSPSLTSSVSGPFTINPAPTEATVSSPQTTICTGTGTSLSFEGSAGSLVWEKSTDGQNFSTINGQTTADYSTGDLTQDTWYRVKVTNSCGSLTSEPLKITIGTEVTIPVTQQPTGEIDLCVTKVTLTIPNEFTNVVWSTGRTGNVINITQPGTYFATGMGPGGCQGRTADYTYTKSPEPIAGFTYNQPYGYTIQFTNTSQNGVTYHWDFGNDTSIVESPSYDFPYDNTYPVTMIVTNSCGSDTATMDVVVQKFVSIEDLPGIHNINVYPVPSHDKLFISLQKISGSSAWVELLDISGRTLLKERLNGQGQLIHTLSLEAIAAGTYIVRIQQDGASSAIRVQKQ